MDREHGCAVIALTARGAATPFSLRSFICTAYAQNSTGEIGAIHRYVRHYVAHDD